MRKIGLLAGAAVLAMLLGPPLVAADEEELDDPAEQRRQAIEALRDATEAETEEELERAIERFNAKATAEHEGVRQQLMDRIDREEE